MLRLKLDFVAFGTGKEAYTQNICDNFKINIFTEEEWYGKVNCILFQYGETNGLYGIYDPMFPHVLKPYAIIMENIKSKIEHPIY